MQLLTDPIIKRLAAPKTGLIIYRDSKVRGLGVRVLPSGTKAFVLDYTTGGRRRVYTIGKIATGDNPGWTVAAARDQALSSDCLPCHRQPLHRSGMQEGGSRMPAGTRGGSGSSGHRASSY